MNIKIIDKNGVTLKTKGKYCKEDISVSVDESILGATITTKGGWTGMAVPNEGLVENVYFNTELSVDEVVSVIESANLTYDSSILGGTPSYVILGNNSVSNAKLLFVCSLNGAYVIVDQTFNIYFSSAIVEGMTTFEGWNSNFNGIIEINFEVMSSFSDTQPLGTQNDLLASLVSTTPFVKSEAQEILLEGEYDGSTVEVKELPKGGWEGTTVPNTGYVKKVYINTELSNDEVNQLISKLSFYEEPSQEGLFAYMIVGFGNNVNIHIMKNINGYGIFYNGLECLYSTETGWLDISVTELEFNSEIVNPENDLFYVQNDKLSSLFSITPFTKSKLNTIDLKPYIDKKQIPLNIKVNVKKEIIECSELPSVWKGTPVPNTGYVEDVYFNTELSVEKVDYLLSRLTYTQTTLHDKPISPLLLTEKYEALGAVKFNDGYALVYMSLSSGMQIPCYCSSPSAGTTVLGWLMEEDRKDLPQIFDSNALSEYFGLQVGAKNNKLSSLISTIPFEKNEYEEGQIYRLVNLVPYINTNGIIVTLDEFIQDIPFEFGYEIVEELPTDNIIESIAEECMFFYACLNDMYNYIYVDGEWVKQSPISLITILDEAQEGFNILQIEEYYTYLKGEFQKIGNVNKDINIVEFDFEIVDNNIFCYVPNKYFYSTQNPLYAEKWRTFIKLYSTNNKLGVPYELCITPLLLPCEQTSGAIGFDWYSEIGYTFDININYGLNSSISGLPSDVYELKEGYQIISINNILYGGTKLEGTELQDFISGIQYMKYCVVTSGVE